MNKQRFAIILAAVCLLAACFALVACANNGHVHKFGKFEVDENEHWRICTECGEVLDVPGIDDREVYVGIRPEGFVYAPEKGALICQLRNVEVMGRDVSIVSTNEASENPIIRAIVDADNKVDVTQTAVRFNLKPHKVFVFDKETEARLYFNNER